MIFLGKLNSYKLRKLVIANFASVLLTKFRFAFLIENYVLTNKKISQWAKL